MRKKLGFFFYKSMYAYEIGDVDRLSRSKTMLMYSCVRTAVGICVISVGPVRVDFRFSAFTFLVSILSTASSVNPFCILIGQKESGKNNSLAFVKTET